MSNKTNIMLLALAVALTGCGKKDGASTTAAGGQAQETSGQTSVGKDAFGSDIYKDPDGGIRVVRAPVLPLDRYVQINIDENFKVNGDDAIAQVAALYRTAYWAGARLNYDMLAQDFVPDAWSEKDAFKLADIAKQNKGKLDAAYAEARKNQHFALLAGESDGVHVEAYDSVRKGFKISFSSGEKSAVVWEEPRKGAQTSRYWALTQLGGGSELDQYYIPASEEEARRIEAALSGKRDSYGATRAPAYYLTHAVGASNKAESSGHQTALLLTDGVIVLDPASKAPLFTVDMRAVSPKPKVYADNLRSQLLDGKAGQ